MEHAEDFSELAVYQLARQLAKEIFAISKTFPKEETYSLTDQIRRSSRSIGGQIAEAWAKRNYERHFVSKLSDGDGEQLETKHWLFSAWDCQYISDEERARARLEIIKRIRQGRKDASINDEQVASILQASTPEEQVQENRQTLITDNRLPITNRSLIGLKNL